jgi:hypothetical protein
LVLIGEGWELTILAGDCLFTKLGTEINPAAVVADLERCKSHRVNGNSDGALGFADTPLAGLWL